MIRRLATNALALAAICGLTACMGGGGTSSATSGNGNTVDQAAVQTSDPTMIRAAGSSAAVNRPVFGSVTQSSNAGSVGGVTTDAASVTFDGTDVKLTVTRDDDSSFTLDGAKAQFGSKILNPVMTDYTFRSEGLLGWDDESVTMAAVYTNWDDENPEDYLAGGYWMHLEGSTDPLTVTGAEIGAFVDGPEIESAPTLPATGTATYTGQAGGLYTAYSSEGVEVGEFFADSSFTANFTNDKVSGCIGCGQAKVYSVTTGVNGRDVNGHLELGETPIENDGTFRDDNVTFVTGAGTPQTPGGIEQTTEGSWGGRFSNIATEGGVNPRLAAGTAGAKWTSDDETSGGVLVGAWFATEE